MEKAILVIVTLLWQGHWFGGQAGTVSFQWANAEKSPDAVVSWEVLYDKTPLGKGRLALKAGDKVSTVSITMPEVRVRTQVKLRYQVLTADGKQELSNGEQRITLYPKELLAPWAKRAAEKSVVVWDSGDGLPVTLKAAEVPHQHVTGGGGLQMVSADIILVGQDQIDGSEFGQVELLEQVKAGSSVVIFSQKDPKTLMESPVLEKPLPAKLEWKYDHVLLKQLMKEDWGSLLTGKALKAVTLEAPEAKGAVVYWPVEKREEEAPTLDAVIAVKPLGKGQVVFWQLPLGKWAEDPRSQAALAGALDYLLGRGPRAGEKSSSAVGASRGLGTPVEKEVVR
jgi:hypothetical protein